jgi:uncharacterized protein (TIGR00661 family)
MKILYAIQGTGNGHVCRAREIVPILRKKADTDVLISGIQSDVDLPFEVQYSFGGLSYIFGKKGGIDLLETYKKSKIKKLLHEVKELQVDNYDLVISDFEPVSAWACYMRNKPCIGLSHQAAVLNKKAPQPKHNDAVGRMILKVYAPVSVQYGFHFNAFDKNIFTPVIRTEIREAPVSDNGHYTVYLPAYSDKKIVDVLSQCPGVRWEVFSKHFEHEVEGGNIRISTLHNSAFIESLASCAGVVCGAGFETPAEALYLKKKLLVIPMKNQYEQHCNAAALQEMGVPVLKSLKEKHLPALHAWLEEKNVIDVDYPDNTEDIIDYILHAHTSNTAGDEMEGVDKFTVKKFKQLTMRRIVAKLGS